MRAVFGDADVMSTKSLLAALQNIEESPWRDLKGKPLDDRGLATRLRQYGVKPKDVKPIPGGTALKGYHRTDLYDAWTRYLPSPPSSRKSATSATSATSVQFQAHKVAVVADIPLPVADNPVAHVAHAVADTPSEKTNGFNGIAAVAAVADFPGDGQICAQCRREPLDGMERLVAGQRTSLAASRV